MRELTCRALLFDLDGVLADSTAAVERQWRAWAARAGLDPEPILRVLHGRRAIDTLRDVSPPGTDVEAEVAWLLEAETRDTAGIVAIPGAPELVASLPPGSWAVVTSGMRRVALARLAAAGIAPPSVLLTAEDLTRGKPDPEGYLAAAGRLGVPPADCVVIEDAPAGVRAARAAGMRCVALATTHPAAQLAGADLLLPDLRSLSAAVLPRGEDGRPGLALRVVEAPAG